MPPITVLHVIDTLQTGGAETQLIQTIPRLDRDAFRQVVCPLLDGAVLPQFSAPSVEVYPLGLSSKNDIARGVARLRRIMSRVAPDLLHTHLFQATLIGRLAGKLTGVPVVTTLASTPYTPEWRRDDPALNWMKVQGVRLIDAATAQATSQYVAISEAVRQSALYYLAVPPDRIRVIYRGVPLDPARVRSAEQQRPQVRGALGVGPEDLLLVNVGRLVPQKGQRYLIDAMALLRAAVPQARLVIAGEGRLRRNLEEQIRGRGLAAVVRLLGDRHDVPALVGAADIFVFPSVSEGFGGALLEAMALGRPCIASDLPVIREVFGLDALVRVPARSAPGLAQAVARLAADDDLRRNKGAAARARAEMFDLGQAAQKLEDLYRKVSGRSPNPTVLRSERLATEAVSPSNGAGSWGRPTVTRTVGKWARLSRRLVAADHRPGITMLMYHRVGGGTDLELDLPVSVFVRQLEYLRRRYRIIGLDALRQNGGQPPTDGLVLSFDDGYAETHSVVFPVLERLRIPATVYLSTAYIEEQRPFDWGIYRSIAEHLRPRPMTWEQARSLLASGLISVGGHTHTHLDLSQAAPGDAEREVGLANDLLARRLGIQVRHFAYPFGRSGSAARQIIARHYETAAAAGGAKNLLGAIDPLNLWRVPVSQSDGFWLFRLRLATLAATPANGIPSPLHLSQARSSSEIRAR